jgi:hypothetical protein
MEDIIQSQKEQGHLGGKPEKKIKSGDKKKSDKVEVAITVHSAKVWVSTDSNGLSDPYVKVIQQGVINKTLLTTPTIKENLNPVWEYTKTVRIPPSGIFYIQLYDDVSSYFARGSQFCRIFSWMTSLEKQLCYQLDTLPSTTS